MHREANDLQLQTLLRRRIFRWSAFIDATRAHVGDRVAPLKPGAVELMDALDELALPFGLATSSRRPWVERHFAAHGLTERFRAVVTRQDVCERQAASGAVSERVASCWASRRWMCWRWRIRTPACAPRMPRAA